MMFQLKRYSYAAGGPGIHGTDTTEIEGNGAGGSIYVTWSNECPLGAAVCGVKTKVEFAPSSDFVGLNNIKLKCCYFLISLQVLLRLSLQLNVCAPSFLK